MEREGESYSRRRQYLAVSRLRGTSVFRGTIAAFALAAVALLAVEFSMTREGTTVRDATDTPSHASTPKPAYTPAEEAYIQALWPIHGDVERVTLRASLGKIFYKNNDLSKAELKARIDAAMATYEAAETRITALQPPPSLASAREDYLTAIRLFKQSASETLLMFDDGNDEHLLTAYPLSQEGSTRIRAVGARFWQDEFPPN